MSAFLETLVGYVWGLPLVTLLLGSGLYLAIRSGFRNYIFISHSFRLLFKGNPHQKGEGQITGFQALSNELAATIGLGNIAGVAVAISQGGPGAVFWMWVAALIGMNTKFYECTLGVLKRGKDSHGEVQGGAMYIWSTVQKPWAKFLAWSFALCGLIGTLSLFQINQMSRFLELQYSVPPLLTGLIIAFLVLVVLSGGLKRIATVCTSLVPTMALFYMLLCLWILGTHFQHVPALFASIFEHAFTGASAWGGFSGFAVAEIMKIGLRRATFSNEAGLGTAPMAHSNVRTSEPATQGFMAMLSPFLDTIIACTMTALVILLAYEPSFQGQKGIDLSLLAFGKMIPVWGPHLLSVAIFLFSFTTIVGCANYNSKCWDFVFKKTPMGSNRIFISWYVITIAVGSVLSISDVVNLIDIGYGLMAVPNVLALLYFRKEIQNVSDRYIETYLRRR